MRWFSNLRLSAKLIVAFVGLLLINTAVGVLAVKRLADVNEEATQLATNWLPSVRVTSALNANESDVRVWLWTIITAQNATELQDAEQRLASEISRFNANLAEYEPLVSTDEERRLLTAFKERWKAHVEVTNTIHSFAKGGDNTAATALMIGASRAVRLEATSLLDTLVANNSAGADQASARAAATYASARLWIAAAIIASIVFGLVLAFAIARIVSRPVQRLTHIAEQLALGDVDQVVVADTTDEVGVLATAFAAMISSQRGLADAAHRLAAGDTSVAVSTRGSKDVLGHAFVQLRGTMASLVTETGTLVSAAKAGDLSRRGDAAKYQGAFQDLVQGINDTLNAVVEPVVEASQVLERVADRDLTVRVQGNYSGDHARIKNSLNSAIEILDVALGQVNAAAGQVAAAGDQITAGSQQLAQGSSEQAASLEEVASSMQEMAAMSQQSAKNAVEARTLAEATRSSAQEGGVSMTRLSSAMLSIQDSADRTARIVKTIDEIAFQTNLLALNAAVEAARAGDAGKGFAVVADEVRSLAIRASEASKQTAELIELSVANAKTGVQLNSEVQEKLSEITTQVTRMVGMVDEVAAASAQQSVGVSQINQAIEQINIVTQGVAANAEESASAAEELSGQSQTLSAMVGEFHLTAEADARRMVTGRTTASSRRTRGAPRGAAVPTSRVFSNGGAQSRAQDEEDLESAMQLF